ncbi:hypothetical protein ANABIO32_32830 [Rossellomorea marisflavi]|nr:hypothetical protein ANABIO32_32830 [Rossellomorea marisflavi]
MRKQICFLKNSRKRWIAMNDSETPSGLGGVFFMASVREYSIILPVVPHKLVQIVMTRSRCR